MTREKGKGYTQKEQSIKIMSHKAEKLTDEFKLEKREGQNSLGTSSSLWPVNSERDWPSLARTDTTEGRRGNSSNKLCVSSWIFSMLLKDQATYISCSSAWL